MKYKVLVSCVVQFDLEIEADSNEEAEAKAESMAEVYASEYIDVTVVHDGYTGDQDQWIQWVNVHEQSLIENGNVTG